MSNPNPNASLIQSLLDDGELLPPTIVLDGIVMTASSGIIPPAPQYDAAGWGLVPTEIGGRASKGGDALIAELNAAGGVNAAIGAWFQANASKVISRFYAKPCAYGFAQQDGRFATPPSFTPLTESQFRQSIINGVALNNHEFSIVLGGDRETIKNLYRGETDKTPPAVIDKAREYDPNAAAWAANHMSFYDVAFYNLLGGFRGSRYVTFGTQDASASITGHNVCDAFFDTQTDAHWGRYLRACARAMGATIPAV